MLLAGREIKCGMGLAIKVVDYAMQSVQCMAHMLWCSIIHQGVVTGFSAWPTCCQPTWTRGLQSFRLKQPSARSSPL